MCRCIESLLLPCVTQSITGLSAIDSVLTWPSLSLEVRATGSCLKTGQHSIFVISYKENYKIDTRMLDTANYYLGYGIKNYSYILWAVINI